MGTHGNNNNRREVNPAFVSLHPWNPITVLQRKCCIQKKGDDQQDPDVTNLNDGQLKALLDEALTYKCPKDRVGKSPLFNELLLKAESDKVECSDDGNQRELNANRFFRTRRGIRHNVSTASSGEAKGGSLQNLAQDATAEFEAAGGHGGARSRRSKRGCKEHGVSVSARQREGGSLPSNVNVGGCGMKTSALLFEDLRGYDSSHYPFSRHANDTGYNSVGESSRPPKSKEMYGLDSKSSSAMSKEEISFGEFASGHRASSAAAAASSATATATSASADLYNDFHVINMVDVNFDSGGRESTRGSSYDDGGGVEMQPMGGGNGSGEVVNYTTHATFEVADAARDSDREVDGQINIALLQSNARDGVNCSDFGSLQMQSEVVNKSSLHDDRAKTKASSQAEMVLEPAKHGQSAMGFNMSHDMSVIPSSRGMLESRTNESAGDRIMTLRPHYAMTEKWSEHNRTMECMQKSEGSPEVRQMKFYAVSCQYLDNSPKQLSEPHSKLLFNAPEEKKLDENGNAITNGERKNKLRKTKPKTNHKEYLAEHVTGYQGNKEIDELLRFIESDKEGKNKCMLGGSGKPGKIRKSAKSEDSSSDDKLKRSNSLEEISKSKLEDLTSESSLSGVVRRPKKQATLDDADLRGDRRSWGTEEGQQYYCNDAAASADETSSRRKRRDKDEAPPGEEADFLTVKKKQRRKNRRSSSGGRGSGGLASRYTQGPPRPEKRPGGFPPHDRDVLYQYRRPRSPDLRRKSTSSMPPSDKSDSSDLDSVHSLPVSSTKPAAGGEAAGGAAPLASYADIAKISAAAGGAPPPPANINVNATRWPAISGTHGGHNAQFITSARVNIGAPPVSAAKSAASVASSDADDAEAAAPKPRADPRARKSPAAAPVNFKTILPYSEEDAVAEAPGTEAATNPADCSQPEGVARGDADAVVNDCEAPADDNAGVDRVSDDNADQAIAAPNPVALPSPPPCDDRARRDLSDNNKANVANDNFVRDNDKVTPASKKPVTCDPPKKRPPVIILDEKESLATTDSALSFTFGFEVNQQLLSMADDLEFVDNAPLNGDYVAGERTVNSVPAPLPQRANEAKPKKANKSSAKPVEQSRPTENHVSVAICAAEVGCVEAVAEAAPASGAVVEVAGEAEAPPAKSAVDFSARYRPPAADQLPAANELVDFIGQAWREVFCTDGVTYFADLSG